MDVTIVDNEFDKKEMDRVMDGHAAKIDGECPDWNDEGIYPRKQWLWFSDADGDEKAPYVVVDNRDGECFVGQFATLDGAMLYICDCHTTCDNQDNWDYAGAVYDRGGFSEKDTGVTVSASAGNDDKWVIRCPIAFDQNGEMVFGYAKHARQYGKTSEIFADDPRDAIWFNSKEDAVRVAKLILPKSFDEDANIVPLRGVLEEFFAAGGKDVSE